MSTDKTLADVQPGGRVRLGNVRDRVMGECEQWFDTSDVDMEAATDSIIAAAQPSPGGQDTLASLPLYRLADDANGNRGLHRDETGSWVKLQDVERALAARQPVGEPVAWMHTHKATGRVKFGLSPMYDCDFNAVQWDSVALYAAPAQAVDLWQFRQPVQDWLDDAQASMEEHGDYDGVFGHAIEEGTRLLALIDSQAAGK